MSLFKRRRFPVEIILLCVRWYCKYGISYRDLAEMMQERGVVVDPSHDLPLGSALCPRDREAGSPVSGLSLWLLAGRRDLCAGRREMEVSVSCGRQARPADRLHAVRPAQHQSSLSLPAQSPEDDERLSALLNHD